MRLCEKMAQMGMYFKRKTDAAQNLIDKFFSNFDCQMTFPREDFK